MIHTPTLGRRAAMASAALALAGGLAGCAAAPQVEDYTAEKPQLDLREYFNGTLDAYGIFTDRAGKVAKRFTVVMVCTWQGDEGVLDESFSYSDGTRQKRIWRIHKLANGAYIGRADDVVGEAQGLARGNALRWAYTLRLPVNGTEYEVQFDDWMYLMTDRIMLNKATMSKFGIRLGEVTLSFTKRP